MSADLSLLNPRREMLHPRRVMLRALGGVCAGGVWGALPSTGLARASTPTEVLVACAAHFAPALQRLAPMFTAETGHRLVISSAATGALAAQVRHGAPFHVFLSADDRTPARLAEEGWALAPTRMVYAIGRLVLWSADPQRVDAQGAVLLRPPAAASAERLAIANPKTAPYGAAAVEVLDRLGVAARWQSRLVQGENIAQTFQFVASGNAALGFVAASQLKALPTPAGSAWWVPAHLHTPLRHEAVQLSRGARHEGAQALLAFLRSDRARSLMRDLGYGDGDGDGQGHTHTHTHTHGQGHGHGHSHGQASHALAPRESMS